MSTSCCARKLAAVFITSVFAAFWPGCAAEPPKETLSYAEALSIYNSELETLDRLQKKRDELASKLKPTGLGFAEDLLDTTTELFTQRDKALEELGLDIDLSANGETETERAKNDPLATIRGRISDVQQEHEENTKSIREELTKLDKEIEEQKKRVERAKADRDAADASRHEK